MARARRVAAKSAGDVKVVIQADGQEATADRMARFREQRAAARQRVILDDEMRRSSASATAGDLGDAKVIVQLLGSDWDEVDDDEEFADDDLDEDLGTSGRSGRSRSDGGSRTSTTVAIAPKGKTKSAKGSRRSYSEEDAAARDLEDAMTRVTEAVQDKLGLPLMDADARRQSRAEKKLARERAVAEAARVRGEEPSGSRKVEVKIQPTDGVRLELTGPVPGELDEALKAPEVQAAIREVEKKALRYAEAMEDAALRGTISITPGLRGPQPLVDIEPRRQSRTEKMNARERAVAEAARLRGEADRPSRKVEVKIQLADGVRVSTKPGDLQAEAQGLRGEVPQAGTIEVKIEPSKQLSWLQVEEPLSVQKAAYERQLAEREAARGRLRSERQSARREAAEAVAAQAEEAEARAQAKAKANIPTSTGSTVHVAVNSLDKSPVELKSDPGVQVRQTGARTGVVVSSVRLETFDDEAAGTEEDSGLAPRLQGSLERRRARRRVTARVAEQRGEVLPTAEEAENMSVQELRDTLWTLGLPAAGLPSRSEARAMSDVELRQRLREVKATFLRRLLQALGEVDGDNTDEDDEELEEAEELRPHAAVKLQL